MMTKYDKDNKGGLTYKVCHSQDSGGSASVLHDSAVDQADICSADWTALNRRATDSQQLHHSLTMFCSALSCFCSSAAGGAGDGV
jgi:hypothetical protein